MSRTKFLTSISFKSSFITHQRPFSRLSPSCTSSSSSDQSPSHTSPTTPPTKPTNSSTSAHDFKLSRPRGKPPPLPSIDPPRWSAEQAVTNILYNTPPPSNQPFNRHVLNCLVQNEPGVLSRVSGTLAGRGFNIESLVVCATEIPELSRMCIVLKGQGTIVEKARRQLEDLVPVWAVLDYTLNKKIERELLLVKISILGPEYFEDQLHAKSNSLYPAQLTSQPISDTPTPETPSESGHLSPSEALRQKHMHLQALTSLASHFAGKVVDVSNDSAIIELCAKTSRIDAFLKLVRPYGILEAARTGTMVMPRASIQSEWQGLADGEEAAEGEAIDAGLLPPG